MAKIKKKIQCTCRGKSRDDRSVRGHDHSWHVPSCPIIRSRVVL